MPVTPAEIMAAIQVAREGISVLESALAKIPQPGAVVEVVNATGRTLTKRTHNFAHGGFGPHLPKTQIGPFQSDAFTLEASGIGSGVEGSVTYHAEGAGEILVGISVPFFGDNAVNANAGPGFDVQCSCLGQISVDKHARARFDMLPRSGTFPEIQADWRSCPKCHGLHFAGFPTHKGVCPVGGAHEQGGSFAYVAFHATPGSGNLQTGWRSCPKCQGMHFPGPSSVHLHRGKGVCPAGGQHDQAGSFDYAFTFNTEPTDHVQVDWRSCRKCQGLFFGPLHGRCPDGGEHDSTGSFNYGVRFA